MPLPYVDANNFTVPGTNYVNPGAARQEEYRQQRILAERQRQSRPKSPEWDYQDHLENFLRPLQQKILTTGTKHSTAKVFFQGKSYTLPPGRTSRAINGLDFGEHYGGLGLTHSFKEALVDSFVNVMRQYRAQKEENKAAEKKSKKFFSRAPKPTQKLAEPDFSLIYKAFNRKLAESRIPLTVNEEYENDYKYGEVFRHPSSESGDLLGEMQAWSDAHWKNVPEVNNRDWTKEVITSLPRLYVPI